MTEADCSKVWVILAAAGIGSRMQSDVPKQYLKIHNKSLIEYALDCFTRHKGIAGIIVALSSEDSYWNKLEIDSSDKPLYTVQGGKQRSDSVISALDYLSNVELAPDDCWVMVHDAARPCLSNDDLGSLLSIRSSDCIGGILASPVRDTMKKCQPGKNSISSTEAREHLWHALTPQMFRLGHLKQAYQFCINKNMQITDDASAIEALGDQPLLVEGSSHNIKVTQPSDLKLVSCLLSDSISHSKEKIT